MSIWTDTSTVDLPPADHPYGAAGWLLGRHPQLVELADRVPGVTHAADGEADIELEVLADALAELDAFEAAREKRFGWSSPSESAWDQWKASQPPLSAAAEEIAVMSGSEVARLRLLATLASAGARLSVSHLRSFDREGQRLIADWLTVVRIG